MANWQQARLISVAGISGEREAEQRATSALLAVLGIVRPFSKALLTPLGASRADKAVVETFIEPTFQTAEKKSVRPDGLIRVSYGSQTPFVALVEVKTGNSTVSAVQVENYLAVAKAEGFDCVLTISNEIPPSPGVHPTGIKIRSNSKVALHHVSWTRVLTTAVMEKVHRGIEDPEQAWILGELIRYLEHPASGSVGFDDMGEHWSDIRDCARDGTLTKRTEGLTEIAHRWDQLLGYASLRLGADIGEDVTEVIPRAHQADPSLRTKSFIDSLCADGTLDGSLRIPDTVSDLDVVVDIRARQNVLSATFDAPSDKGGKGRIGWVLRQLADAPGQLVVEAYPKNARAGIGATLADARESPDILLDSDKKPPVKFRLVARSEMGGNRRSGKRPGFAQSVIASIESFYGDVLQDLVAYQPKAPKLKRSAPVAVAAEPLPTVELIDSTPVPIPMGAVGWMVER